MKVLYLLKDIPSENRLQNKVSLCHTIAATELLHDIHTIAGHSLLTDKCYIVVDWSILAGNKCQQSLKYLAMGLTSLARCVSWA